MFDGAVVGDVVEAIADTDDSSDTLDEVIDTAPASNPRVVLISGAIKDSSDLAAAVSDGVIAITFDPNQSLDDISSSLRTALDGKQAVEHLIQ